jgi:uncharacterized protein YbjT (DUF2867 family)
MGKEKILVFGGTGAQGGSVIDYLLKDGGYDVVTVTRDVTKDAAKKLEERGVKVVRGDLKDKESLRNAFLGVAYVFLVTAPDWKKMDSGVEEEEGRNVIDVAKESQHVKHFIFSSLENVDKLVKGKYKVPHFDSKGRISEYLQQSGLAYSNVLISFYDQNLLRPMGFMKKNDKGELVLSIPLPDHVKLDVFDISQLGSIVLHILKHHEDWNGKSLGVCEGSYTGPEIAGIFSKVLGRNVVFQGADPESAKKFVGEEFANMFKFYVDFEGKIRDAKKCREINPNLHSLEEFIKIHSDHFKNL